MTITSVGVAGRVGSMGGGASGTVFEVSRLLATGGPRDMASCFQRRPRACPHGVVGQAYGQGV